MVVRTRLLSDEDRKLRKFLTTRRQSLAALPEPSPDPVANEKTPLMASEENIQTVVGPTTK